MLFILNLCWTVIAVCAKLYFSYGRYKYNISLKNDLQVTLYEKGKFVNIS